MPPVPASPCAALDGIAGGEGAGVVAPGLAAALPGGPRRDGAAKSGQPALLGDAPGTGDTIGGVAKKLGEPLGLFGGTLKQLRADAVQENDVETITFVDSLYERGYVPATEYSVYAFQGCEENQAFGVLFLSCASRLL